MPYKLRKAPKKDAYWVIDAHGKHLSKKPLPLERAKAQMRAVYAAESGYTMRGGYILNDSGNYLPSIADEAQQKRAKNISRGFRALAHVAEKKADAEFDANKSLTEKARKPIYDYYDALGARVFAEDLREHYSSEPIDEGHKKAIETVLDKAIKRGGARLAPESFYSSQFATRPEALVRAAKFNDVITKFKKPGDALNDKPLRVFASQLIKEDLEEYGNPRAPRIDKSQNLPKQSKDLYDAYTAFVKHDLTRAEAADLYKKVQAVLELGVDENDDLYASITREDPVDALKASWEKRIAEGKAEMARKEAEQKAREERAAQEARDKAARAEQRAKEEAEAKEAKKKADEEQAIKDAQQAVKNGIALKREKLYVLEKIREGLTERVARLEDFIDREIIGRKLPALTREAAAAQQLYDNTPADSVENAQAKYSALATAITAREDINDLEEQVRKLRTEIIPGIRSVLPEFETAIKIVEGMETVPIKQTKEEKAEIELMVAGLANLKPDDDFAEGWINKSIDTVRAAAGDLRFLEIKRQANKDVINDLIARRELANLRAQGKTKQADEYEAEINNPRKKEYADEQVWKLNTQEITAKTPKWKKAVAEYEKTTEELTQKYSPENIRKMIKDVVEFVGLKEGKGMERMVGAGNAYEGDFNHKTYKGPAKCGMGYSVGPYKQPVTRNRTSVLRKLLEDRANQMK